MGKTQVRSALANRGTLKPGKLLRFSLLNLQEIVVGDIPLGALRKCLGFLLRLRDIPTSVVSGTWKGEPEAAHMFRSSVSKKRLLQMPQC